jgi:hypothetical protein
MNLRDQFTMIINENTFELFDLSLGGKVLDLGCQLEPVMEPIIHVGPFSRLWHKVGATWPRLESWAQGVDFWCYI